VKGSFRAGLEPTRELHDGQIGEGAGAQGVPQSDGAVGTAKRARSPLDALKGGMMTTKLAAEFLGTFWLVLGGCGSAVLAATFPGVGIGLLGVSLAFGLTVLTGRTRSVRSPGGISIPPCRSGYAPAADFRLRICSPTSSPRP
jgi:hypothetical protein